MNRHSIARWCRRLLVAGACGFLAVACYAIDNPDAPRLVPLFQSRAELYELRLADSAGTVSATVADVAQYERFLDSELRQAFLALSEKLDSVARGALSRSQQQWLNYRVAESEFIDLNWNLANFGSSSALSRGSYRAAISKDRIVLLLEYLQNY